MKTVAALFVALAAVLFSAPLLALGANFTFPVRIVAYR